MASRIVYGIFMVVLGLLVPWWASLLFLILGCYLYAPWFEAIAIGIFFDVVFGMARMHFHGFQGVYTVVAIASIALTYVIKKRLINI